MSYIDEVLADHPLAFWLLNEPAGSAVAVEATGQSFFNGTYTGTPTLGGAALIATGPAAQTVSTSYASLVGSGALGVNWSVELWFEYVSGTAPIFRDSTSTGGFYFDISGTHPVVGVGLDNLTGAPITHTATGVASSSLKDSARHQVVVTGDGSRARLYLDGVLADSWSGVSEGFATRILLGKDGLNSGHVVASYAALALFAATISAGRVAAHFAAADLYETTAAPVAVTALPVAVSTPGMTQVRVTALPVALSAPVFTESRMVLTSSTLVEVDGPLDTPDPKRVPIHVVSVAVPTPTLVNGRPT